MRRIRKIAPAAPEVSTSMRGLSPGLSCNLDRGSLIPGARRGAGPLQTTYRYETAPLIHPVAGATRPRSKRLIRRATRQGTTNTLFAGKSIQEKPCRVWYNAEASEEGRYGKASQHWQRHGQATWPARSKNHQAQGNTGACCTGSFQCSEVAESGEANGKNRVVSKLLIARLFLSLGYLGI